MKAPRLEELVPGAGDAIEAKSPTGEWLQISPTWMIIFLADKPNDPSCWRFRYPETARLRRVQTEWNAIESFLRHTAMACREPDDPQLNLEALCNYFDLDPIALAEEEKQMRESQQMNHEPDKET